MRIVSFMGRLITFVIVCLLLSAVPPAVRAQSVSTLSGYLIENFYGDAALHIYQTEIRYEADAVQNGWRFWMGRFYVEVPVNAGCINLPETGRLTFVDTGGFERAGIFAFKPQGVGFGPYLCAGARMMGWIYGELPQVFEPASAQIPMPDGSFIPVDLSTPRSPDFPLAPGSAARLLAAVDTTVNGVTLHVEPLAPETDADSVDHLVFRVRVDNQGGFNITEYNVVILALDSNGRYFGVNTYDPPSAGPTPGTELAPGQSGVFDVRAHVGDVYSLQPGYGGITRVYALVLLGSDNGTGQLSYSLAGQLYIDFTVSGFPAVSSLPTRTPTAAPPTEVPPTLPPVAPTQTQVFVPPISLTPLSPPTAEPQQADQQIGTIGSDESASAFAGENAEYQSDDHTYGFQYPANWAATSLPEPGGILVTNTSLTQAVLDGTQVLPSGSAIVMILPWWAMQLPPELQGKSMEDLFQYFLNNLTATGNGTVATGGMYRLRFAGRDAVAVNGATTENGGQDFVLMGVSTGSDQSVLLLLVTPSGEGAQFASVLRLVGGTFTYTGVPSQVAAPAEAQPDTQIGPPQTADSFTFVVESRRARNYTGLKLQAGDTVSIERMNGFWRAGPDPVWPMSGPDGDPQVASKATFPVPDRPIMSLVAGVGDGPTSYIGNFNQMVAANSGELWLGANDDNFADNDGVMVVYIHRLSSTDASAAGSTDSGSLAAGTLAITHTTDGDMLNVRSGPGTNFAILERVASETVVSVLEGPVSAEAMTWWRVRTPGGTEGWVVERSDGVTTLLPYHG